MNGVDEGAVIGGAAANFHRFRQSQLKRGGLDPARASRVVARCFSQADIGDDIVPRREFLLSRSTGASSVYAFPGIDDGLIAKNAGDALLYRVKGYEPFVERIEKKEQARSICERFKLDRLSIPKGIVFQGHTMIEERLPIQTTYLFTHVPFYHKHAALFGETVGQFTRLLVHSVFTDLLTDQGVRIDSSDSKARFPRCDNLPLYIEDELINIGLIDLEHFSFRRDEDITLESVQRACLTALAFFPKHSSEILAVAMEYFPDIESSETQVIEKRYKAFGKDLYYYPVKVYSKNGVEWLAVSEPQFGKELLRLQKSQLAFFESIQVNVCNALEKRGVTLNTPPQYSPLNEDIAEKVKVRMLKKFSRLDQGGYPNPRDCKVTDFFEFRGVLMGAGILVDDFLEAFWEGLHFQYQHQSHRSHLYRRGMAFNVENGFYRLSPKEAEAKGYPSDQRSSLIKIVNEMLLAQMDISNIRVTECPEGEEVYHIRNKVRDLTWAIMDIALSALREEEQITDYTLDWRNHLYCSLLF